MMGMAGSDLFWITDQYRPIPTCNETMDGHGFDPNPKTARKGKPKKRANQPTEEIAPNCTTFQITGPRAHHALDEKEH